MLELQWLFARYHFTKYECDKIGNQVAFVFTRVSLAHLPIKNISRTLNLHVQICDINGHKLDSLHKGVGKAEHTE